MIQGIDLDHVAVAAEQQTDLWPRYATDLGGQWVSGGGSSGFAAAQVRYANGMRVEALMPNRVEENDFLRRFLDRNGPGPHHLTFKVKDIRAALAEAETSGYRPVAVNLSSPEWQEAFLHPKDAPGVVVQLAQAAGDWQSPAPPEFPVRRREQPATLLYVAHAVASLDEGLRLFRGLLGGEVVAEGSEDGGRWTLLAWPGPGRVRLLQPGPGGGPVGAWLGERPGRVHHIAFALDDPAGVPDAKPGEDGTYEVPPEANLGTRLVLHAG